MEKKNYMHSLRVAYENWIDPKRFEDLLALLKEYPCNVSALALFTSSTHAPLTLTELKRRADIMKLRMERARECGFSSGINILATIGHHEEDLGKTLGDKYTHMTGKNGDICRGSYCMNDQNFIADYVEPTYKILLSANPQFIWIDDDLRCGHLPIGIGCFCDNCIALFNSKNNTNYTREELVERLESGCSATRKAWLLHTGDGFKGIFKAISDVVYDSGQSVTLGFMTGERYNEGYDFYGFAEVLSRGGEHKIMWRPGGGAYNDYEFDLIVKKGCEMARQNAYLPEYVEIIQSELENFPYQLLKKTPVSTALEIAWAMTCGCTGSAFNMLPGETNEPVTNIKPHMQAIDSLKDFYILLQDKVAGKMPIGISAAWSPDSKISALKGDYNECDGNLYSDFVHEFFEFGLPQGYNPESAVVNLVKGEATAHWDEQRVKKLLLGAVYMDGVALENLNKRGFGALTGFEVEKRYPVDARELYAEHPLNKGMVGGIRNCRQAFHPGEAIAITPKEDATVVSSLMDYSCERLADCTHGIYQNAEGGRISVGGYYPFSWLLDCYKVQQLKNLMLWLSDNKLPSYVDTYCRIRNHTFETENGYVVALMNPTNQPYKGVRVAIKTDKTKASYYDMSGKKHTVKCDKSLTQGAYRFFTIDKINAYEMRIIEV